ncbi:hypothetical protein [Pseudomonas phage vB_PseuGesM_254]|uniref:Uncharacterized protein n=1 Tax=Pseudomonas phage vB_PseuGesM_254 TaxID=3092638 RepID=A0AAX4G6N4_9CAUD|nr:hypothetical protein [Pseudomonas phage PseuGes_254]
MNEQNAFASLFTKPKVVPGQVVSKALEGFDAAVQKLKDAQTELATHREEIEHKIVQLQCEAADTHQHEGRLSRVVDRFTEMLK